MGVVEEYREHMQPLKILGEQLLKAQNDKNHPFRKVAEYLQKNNTDKAMDYLMQAFDKIKKDPDSELSWLVMKLYDFPMMSLVLKHAEKNFDSKDIFQMPIQIIKMAGVGVGIREGKSRAGKAKGKGDEAKVISKWETYTSKEKGAEAFAKWCFNELGGSYDEQGNKKKGVPSVRTIAKIIRNLPDYRNSRHYSK